MSEEKIKKIVAAAVLIVCLTVIVVLIINPKILIPASDTPDPDKTATQLQQEMNTVYIGDKAYLFKEDISTVLFIGLDSTGKMVSSGSYNNTVQADFLLLACFDHSAKSYTLIQINRDTMTEMDVLGVTGVTAGTRVAQIALSHTYGNGLSRSCQNTVKAVSKLLYGIKVDRYLSANMSAVAIANDSIGGVTLTLDNDYTDINPAYTAGSVVKLTGNDALAFIRSRHGVGDGTNMGRMHRQKIYMQALIESLSEKAMSTDFLVDVYSDIDEYTVTDLGLSDADDLSDWLSEYDFRGIVAIEGESVKGDEFMEFYVNEQALQALAVNMFYEEIEG